MAKKSWREKKIWLARVKPVIDELFEQKCPFYRVQYHFNENIRLIRESFDLKLELQVRDISPHPITEGKKDLVTFGCRLEGKRPQILIFLPEIERLIHQHNCIPNVSSSRIEAMVRCAILAGFMHETDHLALSLVLEFSADYEDIERIIEAEIVVNARTCENTIVPLMEECGQHLTFGAWLNYQVWIDAGRRADSPRWRQYIRDLYSGNLKK